MSTTEQGAGLVSEQEADGVENAAPEMFEATRRAEYGDADDVGHEDLRRVVAEELQLLADGRKALRRRLGCGGQRQSRAIAAGTHFDGRL